MPGSEQQQLERLTEIIAEILRKQRDIEARLLRLERGGVSDNVLADSTPPSRETVIPAAPVLKPPQVFQPEEKREEPREVAAAAGSREEKPTFESKLGLTLVNRIGVVTLILGAAFFFKWAVDNNWIGPGGRVILGLLAGFGALGLADYLWRKAQQVFAQGITGAGLAFLYVSLYAAFGFYHLIPQVIAFLFMATTSALAFALSLRYGARAIAFLGLLGGYLTPILLSTGQDRPWFLLSYILFLDAAAVALVRRRKWRPLEWFALVATALLYIFWLSSRFAEHKGSLPGSLAVFAYYGLFAWSAGPVVVVLANALGIFALGAIWQNSLGAFFSLELLLAGAGFWYGRFRRYPASQSVALSAFWLAFGVFVFDTHAANVLNQFAGISAAFAFFLAFHAWLLLNRDEADPLPVQALSALAANGPVYFGFAYYLLDTKYHDWLGLLAVAVAAAYLGLALLLFQNRPKDDRELRPMVLSAGLCTAFLALAIPIQFAGFRITIAWAIQAAALTWIGRRLLSNYALIGGAAIFFLVLFRLLALDPWVSESPEAYSPLIWNTRFLTFAIASICAFLAARWSAKSWRVIGILEYFGGHFVLLVGLAYEVVAWAVRSASPANLLSVETVSVSILIGIYGVILVSLGVATRTALNRAAGLVLLGFIILKLYVYDVWQLGRAYRIAAFVALGLLLISTSFLYSRFRELIEGLLRNDQARD